MKMYKHESLKFISQGRACYPDLCLFRSVGNQTPQTAKNGLARVKTSKAKKRNESADKLTVHWTPPVVGWLPLAVRMFFANFSNRSMLHGAPTKWKMSLKPPHCPFSLDSALPGIAIWWLYFMTNALKNLTLEDQPHWHQSQQMQRQSHRSLYCSSLVLENPQQLSRVL